MVTTREAMLIVLIVLPFASSAIIGFFRSTAHNNEAWFAGAVALFGLLLKWGGGVNFTLQVDGLAWTSSGYLCAGLYESG